MSARIRRNSDFLKVLRKCTPAQGKAILEVAHNDLLEALTEYCMNICLKTITVNEPAKRSAFAKGTRVLVFNSYTDS